jgi:cell division protease FtsH
MMQRQVHMSDETQQIVDAEVKRFVEEGYTTAQNVIRENIDGLHTIAQALIEYETLTGDEIRNLMDGIPPVRDDGTVTTPKTTGVPSAGKTVRKRPDAEPDAAPEPQPGS